MATKETRPSNRNRISYSCRLMVLLLSMFFMTGCGGNVDVPAILDTVETIMMSSESESGSGGESSSSTIDTEIPAVQSGGENLSSYLKVHYIDVGQGDATLITCDGEAMLIDAGDNTKGEIVCDYLDNQGVDELKYLVLTHPDADHIGGADVVVSNVDIENVFMSTFTKDNKTYDDLMDALDDKKLSWSLPQVGDVNEIGKAFFQIVAPNREYEDANDASIGLMVTYGKTKFLFTGDAEEEAEADILDNGLSLDCDVFQAGHHGSRTSNTKALLEAASPTYVVVSCEENNSYGHPHAEPMNRFRGMGIKLFRTDEQGSLIAQSNGTDITWNSAPTESWQAGEPKGSSSQGQKKQNSSGSNSSSQGSSKVTYVCNTKSKKFHTPDCDSVETMNPESRKDVSSKRKELINQGYSPCKSCNP